MIQSAGCSRGFDGTLNVFPNEIDWIGHKPVVLNGPCLNEGETAKCRFYDPNGNQSGFSMVPALIEGSDSSTKFICGTPYFYTTGRIKIELAIFNSSNIESNKYTGYINIVSPKKTGNGLKFSLSTIDANGVLMKFNWSIENFENSTGQNVVPKISIWLLKWGLGSVQNNTYILEGSKLSGDLTTENGYSNDTYITDKASFLCQVDPNNLISRIAIVAINAEYDSVDKLRPDDYFTYITGPQVDQIITYVCNNSVLAQMCNGWIQIAQPVGALTTCPPTYNITEYDSNWISDPTCSNYNPECIYNPGADSCVIFSAANQQGSSQQCCYKDEKIFIEVPGGGRAQLYHPSISAGLKHFAYDNLGWFSCCSKQDATLCEKFINLRPSSTVDNNPPGISASYGEPHFVTYDGFRYTFNGLGEYWLLKNNPEQPVAFQARTEQVKSSDGISQVSGITAFVMKSENSSKIQIQQSNIRTADIYIDDVLLDGPFDLDHELDLTGVHIKIAQNLKNFIVSFADGMTFTITPYIRAFGIEVLISSDFKGNKTSGLLGVYNGNSSDDLTLPNGTILPINSTAAEIYFNLKAWNIAKNESLFYYTDGNTYDTFNGQPFSPVANYDPSKVTPEMTALCGGDQFCLFDYVITGDPNFANETKILGNKLSETIKALQEQIPLCSMLTKPENGYVNLETYIPPATLNYFVTLIHGMALNPFYLYVAMFFYYRFHYVSYKRQ
uniref:Sushi domain-containing protein n=1 Tax=Acrobeloides nanus TaxID=290746 RepID=A0A914EN25_9BILA